MVVERTARTSATRAVTSPRLTKLVTKSPLRARRSDFADFRLLQLHTVHQPTQSPRSATCPAGECATRRPNAALPPKQQLHAAPLSPSTRWPPIWPTLRTPSLSGEANSGQLERQLVWAWTAATDLSSGTSPYSRCAALCPPAARAALRALLRRLERAMARLLPAATAPARALPAAPSHRGPRSLEMR